MHNLSDLVLRSVANLVAYCSGSWFSVCFWLYAFYLLLQVNNRSRPLESAAYSASTFGYQTALYEPENAPFISTLAPSAVSSSQALTTTPRYTTTSSTATPETLIRAPALRPPRPLTRPRLTYRPRRPVTRRYWVSPTPTTPTTTTTTTAASAPRLPPPIVSRLRHQNSRYQNPQTHYSVPYLKV